VTYVDQAFKGLKSNLEISQTEEELAIKRHHLIRDHVRTKWTLVDDFLTGSYARHTKTKKLKDVDLFVVVDADGPQAHLQDGTGSAAVQALCDVLSTRWSDVTGDDYVATISYSGEDVASYEVAPVFVRAEGGYWMPNGRGWMATDPTVHAELVTAKNKECDAKFVPFVKMVKGINREADEPVSPSFLLEAMALELVLAPFGRYQDEIRWFLASAADRITEDWPDPAGLGPALNRDMPHAKRAALAEVIRGWMAIAEDAIRWEDAGKERAAVEAWKSLFGWRMPRQSV
jgi:hypothetical protein